MHGGWVYIMCNKPHGVLYVGVKGDLPRRVQQHRIGEGSSFARRHHCTRLVHAEPYNSIDEAVRREKAIKAWLRLWKLRLIQEHNPEWRDLFATIAAVDG
jgi:putative endonuclease